MRRLYSLWVMVHAVLVVNTPNMPSAMGTIKDLKSYVHTVKSRAVDRSTIQFLSILGVLLTETCYYCQVQQSIKSITQNYE